MLLDVSSRADQMGVTLGPAIVVDRDERGDAKLRTDGYHAVRNLDLEQRACRCRS